MQTMKTETPTKSNPSIKSERVIHRAWIALLVAAFAIALLLGTSGFQTYWNKERRLISAADEIVAALKAYSNASPGTAMDFPLELADLRRDPRMLAEVSYLSVLPVDPVAQTQDWGVIRNKNNQVSGVHSLSNESPTLFATFFSLRSGEKYSDWKFTAE